MLWHSLGMIVLGAVSPVDVAAAEALNIAGLAAQSLFLQTYQKYHLPIIIIIRYQIYFLLVFNSAYYYHGMTQGGTYGNTSCGRGHYRSL
jgi:hypothetical protein